MSVAAVPSPHILATLPSLVLVDALRYLDYSSAKQQLTGSRRLNSAYVARLVPQKRHLLHQLLSHQRELGSLYRSQAVMARSVAAMYSTMITQRNEQSHLYERKKQLNGRIGELISAARAKLEEFHTAAGLPILTAQAEEKRREVQELIAKADTLFQQRDALDTQLDQLDHDIEAVEVESKANKEKFTAGETVLERVKDKVDTLKAMIAGPAPSTIPSSSTMAGGHQPPHSGPGQQCPFESEAETTTMDTPDKTPSRKRRHSSLDDASQREEGESAEIDRKARRKRSAET